MKQRMTTWQKVIVPILTALWICWILSRSMKTGTVSASESGRYLDGLRRYFPWMTMFIVRKSAHFLEFFVLGLLLFLDFKLWWRRCFWLPVLCGLLVAAGDELLQRIIPERSGELADVFLDFSGVLLACLLAYGISVLRKKRRVKHGG